MKYIATILSLLLATVLTQSQSQNQSPDGTCGGQDQFTCTNSLYGPCCSSYGYCGATKAYCDAGCQQAFGTCSDANMSADNTCGGVDGFKCHKLSMECCSDSGYCGNSTAYCGGGCQPKFSVEGHCIQGVIPTNDGRCGVSPKNTTCAGSLNWSGQCCSAGGYCGTTTAHCSVLKGCQAKYGAPCRIP